MKAVCAGLILAGLAAPAVTQAAGFAYNENFSVFAPDQPLAEAVLAKADGFRKEIARQWLDEELPPSAGRAIIAVTLRDEEDSGLTWPIGGDSKRKYHRVWLTTSRQGAIGSTLNHEIVHVVFATRFPDRLAAWAEEGAASLADDQQRIDVRRRTIRWCAKTGNWPDLHTVFAAPTIPTNDQMTYSIAASVTEYLLSRSDKATFVRFAEMGKRRGWDQALQECYGVHTTHDLQTAWQAWACRAAAVSARTASFRAEETPARAAWR